MQEPSFEKLASEAAAGLKADRELYLDVTQELTTHLEEKAERLAKQGHSPTECVELAKKAFGSPLDVASELLEANRRRMRFRAIVRLTFAAVLMPLAVLLALYLGYGRFARISSFFAYTATNSTGVPKLPTLPFFGTEQPASQSVIVRELRFGHAENIRRYWEAHRSEPNSQMFYAYYALVADRAVDGRTYVNVLHQGEQVEPQNALYNVLLAQYYLEQGLLAKLENPEKHTDELRDRQAFELGISELRKAVAKPYYRSYREQVLSEKRDSLPTPVLTEDYGQLLMVMASEIFPDYARRRALVRKIPGCARLLLAEGRRADAETVMDTWKPLMRLWMNDTGDNDLLISQLVNQACGMILVDAGNEVYTQLGNQAKAAECRMASARLSDMYTQWREAREKNGATIHTMIRESGPMLLNIMAPVFGEQGLTRAQLTPGRMHEHVLAEEMFIGIILTLFTLTLLSVLIQGAVWLYRLRGSSAVPLLMMPPARVLLRAVFYGVIMPLVIYWIYSRLPVVGGRQYAFTYWPMTVRFLAEFLVLGGVLLWLPTSIIRRYVRQRCDDLSIPMPDKANETRINRRVFAGTVIAILLLALSVGVPAEAIAIKMISAVLGLGIVVLSMPYIGKARGTHGLYYGTLARSLAPAYALAIIVLSCTAQPWLLYQETKWLHRDTISLGYLANRHNPVSCSSIELETAHRLNYLTKKALEK